MTGIYRKSRILLYADVACEICQKNGIKTKYCLEQIEAGEAIEIVVSGYGQMQDLAICVTAGGDSIESAQRIGDRYNLLIRRQLLEE